MAIIAVASASGSPGVSTLCVGLAMTWPRPAILVEADPTGGAGVLAGYFRGQQDAAGLVELVMAHRQGSLAAALPGMLIPLGESQAGVLVGVKAHEQSVGLPLLWSDLAVELRDLGHRMGQDAIVDVGRLGLDGAAHPLVAAADVVLLLVGNTLPGLAALRSWAASLAADANAGRSVRVVTTGPRQTYSHSDIRATLGLPVLGSIAWQPDAARVLSEGVDFPRGRPFAPKGAAGFAASPLMRSVVAIGESTRALCATDAHALVPDGEVATVTPSLDASHAELDGASHD